MNQIICTCPHQDAREPQENHGLDCPVREFEIEVVDVLSTEYHQCGTRYTEIQLMSDGSVRSTVFNIPEDEQGELPY